ncbi:MAG TPA: glycosyltransferase family 4 protein [Pyrinomonadaceae bacterium]|nr:glycosyltransferase family 4 protein [Pyrinomonadaceae bacterium]
MRILYLTGGAGRMYCGSCLRDNAMATELMKRGHDVMLLPVYTPTLTDEPNVSNDHVVLGGISAYLEQYVPLFRKTPRWLDRLWDSKTALQLATRRSISTNPRMLGEMTVSVLKGESGFQRKEIDKFIDWIKHEAPPDVVSLPYTLLLGLAQPIKHALNAPILCTLQGEDLFLNNLHEPYRTESLNLIRNHLPYVDQFLSVSDYYAEFMPGYLGIPREKIRVVPIGINPEGFELRHADRNGPFTVGFFGRIAPEKGLHVLAEAYRMARQSGDLREARLEAAGYIAPDSKPYLEAIQKRLHDAGLGNEFHYRGVLERAEKIAFLRGLDMMSMPATYDEPKGVSLLEAMACGVPLVQPRRGSFTEILERTGGGLLVQPDDPQSLANGILQMARDRDLAADLSANGFRGVREHYTAAHMADKVLEAFSDLRSSAEIRG